MSCTILQQRTGAMAVVVGGGPELSRHAIWDLAPPRLVLCSFSSLSGCLVLSRLISFRQGRGAAGHLSRSSRQPVDGGLGGETETRVPQQHGRERAFARGGGSIRTPAGEVGKIPVYVRPFVVRSVEESENRLRQRRGGPRKGVSMHALRRCEGEKEGGAGERALIRMPRTPRGSGASIGWGDSADSTSRSVVQP